MFSRLKFLLAVVTIFAINHCGALSFTRADIILTLGGNTSFSPDSGVVFLDVLAHSTTGESRTAFTADFSLSSGGFASNDNGFGDGGGFTKTGQLGQATWIGAGNLQGTSFFVFDSGDPSLALVSLDFKNSQPFPTTDQLLLRLAINTTGLASGNYGITVNSNASSTTSLGPFTISAVPEPTSLAIIALGSCGVLRYVRKRSRSKKTLPSCGTSH